MDDATVALSKPKRKGSKPLRAPVNDYNGTVCLLVREPDRKQHAPLEALIDADRLADAAPFDWVIWRRRRYSRMKYIACVTPVPGMAGWVLGLHRFLMNPPKDKVVDHKNRIPWDNRCSNLRICTPKQNSHNASPRNLGGSKFKGVTRDPRRKLKDRPLIWRAGIKLNGKHVLIGCFDAERKAAYAYNVVARHHRGEYAYQNDVSLTDDEVACVARTMERYERERHARIERASRPKPAPQALPPRYPEPVFAIDLRRRQQALLARRNASDGSGE